MVLPPFLLNIATRWHFTCYLALKKIKSFTFTTHHKTFPTTTTSSTSRGAHHNSPPPPSDISKCPLESRKTHSILFDFHSLLLPSTSPFPFFMLVAFEGGGLLRALLLLFLSPLIYLLNPNGDFSLKLMTFATFFGLRKKDMDLVARAVLPKFFLEKLDRTAYETVASFGRKVVVTSVPRVMVERFLKEYLGVEAVYGAELEMAKGDEYFTGFVTSGDLPAKLRKLKDLFGEAKADVGLVCAGKGRDNIFISYCKETYTVSRSRTSSSSSNSNSNKLPREKYPKPLIFHDGRLAFLPTPLAFLAVFLYLPMGLFVAIVRLIIGLVLPYNISIIFGALSGVHFRVAGQFPAGPKRPNKSVLYVCTHRTLIDPILLSTALQRPVPAVTYSLSLVSELIAPIKTVRLTRDRKQDGDTMRKLLSEGELAVCPEGTTCREPYLLRFSSLFAEMTDKIVPVAVDVKVSVFYGTTASGLKWLDPILLVMNPTPYYRVEFLGRLGREQTCAGGWSAVDVANRVQRQLGDALGFECTNLTRKDKYMILAENDGVVAGNHKSLGNKRGFIIKK